MSDVEETVRLIRKSFDRNERRRAVRKLIEDAKTDPRGVVQAFLTDLNANEDVKGYAAVFGALRKVLTSLDATITVSLLPFLADFIVTGFGSKVFPEKRDASHDLLLFLVKTCGPAILMKVLAPLTITTEGHSRGAAAALGLALTDAAGVKLLEGFVTACLHTSQPDAMIGAARTAAATLGKCPPSAISPHAENLARIFTEYVSTGEKPSRDLISTISRAFAHLVHRTPAPATLLIHLRPWLDQALVRGSNAPAELLLAVTELLNISDDCVAELDEFVPCFVHAASSPSRGADALADALGMLIKYRNLTDSHLLKLLGVLDRVLVTAGTRNPRHGRVLAGAVAERLGGAVVAKIAVGMMDKAPLLAINVLFAVASTSSLTSASSSAQESDEFVADLGSGGMFSCARLALSNFTGSLWETTEDADMQVSTVPLVPTPAPPPALLPTYSRQDIERIPTKIISTCLSFCHSSGVDPRDRRTAASTLSYTLSNAWAALAADGDAVSAFSHHSRLTNVIVNELASLLRMGNSADLTAVELIVSSVAKVLVSLGHYKVLGDIGVTCFEIGRGARVAPAAAAAAWRCTELAIRAQISAGAPVAGVRPMMEDVSHELLPMLRKSERSVPGVVAASGLAGVVADISHDSIDKEEWQRIILQISQMISIELPSERALLARSVASMAQAAGPVETSIAFARVLSSNERSMRVCAVAVLAEIAAVAGPEPVITVLLGVYQEVQHALARTGALRAIGQVIQSSPVRSSQVARFLVPVLSDALCDPTETHRQLGAEAAAELALALANSGAGDGFAIGVHFLNLAWGNMFETGHVGESVLALFEALVPLVGANTCTQYVLQGLQHRARSLREVSWRFYNELLISDPASVSFATPTGPDTDENQYEDWTMSVSL